jgi:hypothetical protein
MVLLIWAILARKFSVLYVALTVLALAGVAGAVAMYRFAERSVDELHALATPRTGPEIYAALFGTPDTCVRIIAFDDALLPKLDNVIHLHAGTCPGEMRRILRQCEHDASLLNAVGSSKDARYDPSLLGDSVLTLTCTVTEGRHWRTLYVKRDSSELIVLDVLD